MGGWRGPFRVQCCPPGPHWSVASLGDDVGDSTEGAGSRPGPGHRAPREPGSLSAPDHEPALRNTRNLLTPSWPRGLPAVAALIAVNGLRADYLAHLPTQSPGLLSPGRKHSAPAG